MRNYNAELVLLFFTRYLCPFIDTAVKPAHCKLEKAAEMLKKSDTKRMIINHYHVPQLAGYEEIAKTFPFDISLAYDGLEVNV